MKRVQMSLILGTILWLSLCAAMAQDLGQRTNGLPPNSPAAPIQPLPAEVGSGEQAGTQRTSSAQKGAESERLLQPQSDTHVLSGAETFGLGSLYRLRGVFDPAVQLSELGETGVVAGRTLSTTSIGGSLDIQQRRGRYYVAGEFSGAGTFYEPSYYRAHYLPLDNGAIALEVALGRWTLRLRDDALYSWGYAFSGLFSGGVAQVGNGGLSSIQPSLLSSGTIQTGLAGQLYDTAISEIDYARSRRSTLTFVGTYGVVHFLDPGYINSQDINGRVGYNYALGAQNTIGLSYDRDSLSFTGTSSRLQSDSVQMAFGRKITGRLALQFAGGPQLIYFENFGPSNTQQLNWTASGAVTYQRPRTGYSLSYFRGMTAGSGVFLGSTSQTITATAKHEFTRFWSASINGGYAANTILVAVDAFSGRFNDWFAGANLNRQIGRRLSLVLNYGFQEQTGGGGSCPVPSCGLAAPFSQSGVTLQWHPFTPAVQ